MVLNRINLNIVEFAIKETLELATEARLLQDQLENTLQYLANNEKYFKDGKISKRTYEKNKNRLENEKNILSTRIEENSKNILESMKNLEKTFKDSKI